MSILFFFLIAFSFFIFNFPLQAQAPLGPQNTTSQMWERIYSQSLLDLKYGSSEEKIHAAYMLGVRRNPRFVGPLLEELLKGLRARKQIGAGNNEAYVKSTIAWAIGHVGHPIAVSPMLEALDLSIQIAQAEMKEAEKPEAQEETRQRGVGEIKDTDIKPVYPGPFLAKGKKPGFYYNADKYWSLSDQLRGRTDWLGADPSSRVSRLGANYMNLVRSIFIALGKIGSHKSTAKISSYLDSASYSNPVRSYASSALGDIGDRRAFEKLAQSFEKEKAPLVKIGMGYAILRNDKTRFSVYNSLISFLQKGTVPERLAVAKAFEKLAMGESLESLDAAHRLENDRHIRFTLERAIHNAKNDLLGGAARPRHF